MQVISTCCVAGGYRYYVHYVGWNSRYDEWVDHLRISCKRGPDALDSEPEAEPGAEPEAEPDTDVDSSKSEVCF